MILPVMPASAWPGTEQMNARPAAGTSTTTLAVAPAFAVAFEPSGR